MTARKQKREVEDHALRVVKLAKAKETRGDPSLPAGFGIRDGELGVYRGKGSLGKSYDAWVKAARGAARYLSQDEAIEELDRIIAYHHKLASIEPAKASWWDEVPVPERAKLLGEFKQEFRAKQVGFTRHINSMEDEADRLAAESAKLRARVAKLRCEPEPEPEPEQGETP